MIGDDHGHPSLNTLHLTRSDSELIINDYPGQLFHPYIFSSTSAAEVQTSTRTHLIMLIAMKDSLPTFISATTILVKSFHLDDQLLLVDKRNMYTRQK